MQAIHATTAGGPEVLQIVELPAPKPEPNEVLVDVVAAGVNFIDTYRRSGVYPTPFPHIVGSEGAGTIRAIGTAVTDPKFTVGARVAWAQAPGSYASAVCVSANAAFLVPHGVDLKTAAALPLQGMTAHYLSHSTYSINAGDNVLIHAGAGGVGLLLTQLAVARGARVITTVSNDAKAELSTAAGATDVIRYDQLHDLTTELSAIIFDLTQGKGVDVVYDGVGRSTFDASLKSLATRGTLVVFGGASGQVPPVDLQRLNSAGSVYVTRPKLDDYTRTPAEARKRMSDLFNAVLNDILHVRIGATYSLHEAEKAHRALETRQTTGKVLLLP